MTETAATPSPGPAATEEAQRLHRSLRRCSLACIIAFVVAVVAEGLTEEQAVPLTSESSGAAAIGFLFALVYLVLFLVTMSTARHFGEAVGLRDYRWSVRWNIITCFIPFLNFVRPWLGFGEIYRSLINSAKSRKLDGSWNHGFSWLTFLMGLLVILNLTVLRSHELDRPMTEHPFVAGAFSLVLLAIPIAFLIRIRRAAQRLYALYAEKSLTIAVAPPPG